MNEDRNTIAIYLASKGIIPPEVFMHDVNLENISGYSIKYCLRKHNYAYINGEFIYNYKT